MPSTEKLYSQTPQQLELVIMAAGKSRRYGRLKQLEGFGPQGQTILDYTIYDAIKSGVSRVILVISEENREQFEQQVVEPWACKVEVRLVVQRLEDLPVIPFRGPGPAARTRPWGTGHAVWAVRNDVKGPFVLANADDFYGPRAIAAVAEHLKASADWALQSYALAETLPDSGSCNRGFCLIDSENYLLDIAEKLDVRTGSIEDPEQWVSLNLWGMRPAVFGLLEGEFQKFLAEHGHNPDQEFFLPDALATGIQDGALRIKVLPPVDQWLGVTHPKDADRVRCELEKRHDQGVYPEDFYA